MQLINLFVLPEASLQLQEASCQNCFDLKYPFESEYSGLRWLYFNYFQIFAAIQVTFDDYAYIAVIVVISDTIVKKL